MRLRPGRGVRVWRCARALEKRRCFGCAHRKKLILAVGDPNDCWFDWKAEVNSGLDVEERASFVGDLIALVFFGCDGGGWNEEAEKYNKPTF